MYVYGRVRMAGFASVLHVAHGHGTRSQAILCNVWFSATEHSPADAYVYIYIYGHSWHGIHKCVQTVACTGEPQYWSGCTGKPHAVYVSMLQMVSIQVCHVYANTNNSDERVASESPACRDRWATVPRSPESPPHGKTDQGYQTRSLSRILADGSSAG